MLLVSLDCPLLTTPLVSSNVNCRRESLQDNEHIIGKAYRIYVIRSTCLLFAAEFSCAVFHFCVLIVLIVLPLLVNFYCLATQLFQLNYDINRLPF